MKRFGLFLLSVIGTSYGLDQHIIANITGNAFPLVAPSDGLSAFKVIVTGFGFGTAAAQPTDLLCRIKIPDFEAPLPGPTGPARVINDTAIECTLKGYLTFGKYGIAVESPSHEDPKKKIWWSHGTSVIELRTLVEATPDKRPYMSAQLEEAELLLAIDIGAIAAFPATASAKSIQVCAELTANRSGVNLPGENPYLPTSARFDPSLEGLALLPCQTISIASLPGGSDIGSDRGATGIYNTSIVALPFNTKNLQRLPASLVAANLKISINIGKDFPLEPKFRRFAIASSQLVSGQSFSVVCHKRRMVRVNGEPWVGVGFYVSGTLIVKNAKGVLTHNVSLGKEIYGQLARQGITQIMPYGMDMLTLPERAEIVDYLDRDLNASIKFDMPLVADVVVLLNSTVGSNNYTQAWASLKTKVDSVRCVSAV